MTSKTPFRFKQFSVDDSRCSMKVGTDAVLLGAWTSVDQTNSILDIGTGSGLIALMLAQRTEARITAIEIDEMASIQSRDNFVTSPWSDRLEPVHGSIQHFDPETHFDLIVSNPPFFSNSLKTPDHQRNLARHNDQLSFENLLEAVDRLLSDRGSFAFILPVIEALQVQQMAVGHQLFPKRCCAVSPKEGKIPNRLMIELGRQEGYVKQEILNIRNIDNHYSSDYKELTKEYYLFLKEPFPKDPSASSLK